ncbi:hypothetical protein [Larkinella arboricola]
MGVGLEMIFFLVVLVAGGYLIYRVAFRKKTGDPDVGRPASRTMRLATISAGVGLIIVIALTLEFCHNQGDRMDKNTHEDNSLDNTGKGENEDDHRDDGDETQR